MKKILHSDWLRAVQFKCNTSAKTCNTSAKSVTPVQITHWQEGNEKFCRPMISCKAVTKMLYGNSEKSFLECEKHGFKKHLPAIFLCDFFHVCILYVCMHVFLVQFEINLHLRCGEFFKKLTRAN